jgi:hypothetical protein
MLLAFMLFLIYNTSAKRLKEDYQLKGFFLLSNCYKVDILHIAKLPYRGTSLKVTEELSLQWQT